MRKIKDNAIRKEVTKKYVQKLANNNKYLKINSLNLQICHEKVEIGVCGLFTIDYKLLFAVS
jgi:hypothetical protein